jgi:hypothetical protein
LYIALNIKTFVILSAAIISLLYLQSVFSLTLLFDFSGP